MSMATEDLREWAAQVAGPTVRIYRLSAGTGRPEAHRVGRIGGAAPLTAAEAPRYDGRAMKHVLTLDLSEIPELAARHPGVRALSLFLPRADHEAGVLMPIRESSLAPGSIVGARPLVVEPIDVPAAIFSADREGADDGAAAVALVREMVWELDGYALGGPLWIHEPLTGPDSSFVLRFGEHLVDSPDLEEEVLHVFEDQITSETY